VTKSEGGALTISNVGKSKIEILDITVNDRSDCTMVGMDFLFEVASERDVGLIKLKAEMQDASERDPALLHRMWFQYKTNSMMAIVIAGVFGNKLAERGGGKDFATQIANRKFVLDVGDEETWRQGCQIVRATVNTDRGTQTYTWN
jgi:hypothetical protein